jgi:hypothetical protein
VKCSVINGYNDIGDDDVAFVSMSIRESKWRQITKTIIIITIIISVSFSNFLLILMNYLILYSHYNYSLYNLAQLPIFGTKLSSSHFEGDELVAKTLCDASSMWRRNNISEHISCSFFRSGGLKF